MTRPTVVSVYVPLCSERCAFCDCLTIPSTLRDVVRYREALLAEIDAVAPDLEGQRVEAVRFDGGVPLLMGGAGVAEVLFRLRRRLQVADDAEVTVETVPGKVDEHNLRLFAQIGVNRLEFGVATLVQAEHVRLRCPGVYGQIHEHDALRRHLGPSDWGVEPHVRTARPDAFDLGGNGGEGVGAGSPARVGRPHAAAGPCQRRPRGGRRGACRPAWPRRRALAGGGLCRIRGRPLREAGMRQPPRREPTYAGADEVGLGAGARSLVGGYSYRNVDDVPTYLACSADPERVVKDVAVVDDVARDLLAAARGVSCAAGFAPGRSTAEPQDGPARATGAAGGASRRAGALDACLDSLVRHGWAHKDAAGAYRLTDEGAFHKDEAYRALGACLAGI